MHSNLRGIRLPGLGLVHISVRAGETRQDVQVRLCEAVDALRVRRGMAPSPGHGDRLAVAQAMRKHRRSAAEDRAIWARCVRAGVGQALAALADYRGARARVEAVRRAVKAGRVASGMLSKARAERDDKRDVWAFWRNYVRRAPGSREARATLAAAARKPLASDGPSIVEQRLRALELSGLEPPWPAHIAAPWRS